MTEIKIKLEGRYNRVELSEKIITKHEDRSVEIILSEKQEEK